MSEIMTVTGTVEALGSTFRDDTHQAYRTLALRTVSGVQTLSKVVMAREIARWAHVGAAVTLSLTVIDEDRTIVWGLVDSLGRVHFNEHQFAVRTAAISSAVRSTAVALLGLIVPGVTLPPRLLRTWRTALRVPSPERVRTAVATMRTGVAA